MAVRLSTIILIVSFNLLLCADPSIAAGKKNSSIHDYLETRCEAAGRLEKISNHISLLQYTPPPVIAAVQKEITRIEASHEFGSTELTSFNDNLNFDYQVWSVRVATNDFPWWIADVKVNGAKTREFLFLEYVLAVSSATGGYSVIGQTGITTSITPIDEQHTDPAGAPVAVVTAPWDVVRPGQKGSPLVLLKTTGHDGSLLYLNAYRVENSSWEKVGSSCEAGPPD
jgi:hypothetical protein